MANRRKSGNGPAVAIAFIVTLILLLAIVVVFRGMQLNSRREQASQTIEREDGATSAAEATSGAQTMESIVGIAPAPTGELIAAQVTVESTARDAAETISPTAEPTPVPTEAPVYEYLPVVSFASDVTDKKIAITVDDCFQMENLKTISRLAYNVGGRLTLFPIGENVAKAGMAEVLQVCYYTLGFEIENHTWSHARIFRMSEEDMAAEIWKQSYAVSAALGVNYQQHFFRLMGGDGDADQRTHNYLKQLGFKAIAYWSYSGSDAPLEDIEKTLKPGMVYLFHTTDRDTGILEEFIPYCVQQGYELVTLNELFGYPANETSDISTLSATMPAPQPYEVIYKDEKKGDYSWQVLLIQQKLYDLGYLTDANVSKATNTVADGVFGADTEKAVIAFQLDHGLAATGVADAATQTILFETDTRKSENLQ